MLEGLGLNLIVGLLWAGVGVMFSQISARRLPAQLIYCLGCGFVALVGWIALVDWSVLLSGQMPKLGATIFWMTLAGFANIGGMSLMIHTMSLGHRGLTWAIGQSAMVVPFVASVLIWRDPVAPVGYMGMLCLLAALALISRRHKGTGEFARCSKSAAADRHWLLMAFLTLIVIGLSQTSMTVTSRWPEWEDAANLRLPVTYTASAALMLVFTLIQRKPLTRRLLPWGLLYGAVALTSFTMLFACLDLMADNGLAGIVYPIAIGVCITGFSIYSRLVLKESMKPASMAGLILCLLGVVLLSLS